MAKTVFRPNEIKAQKSEVVLKLLRDYTPREEEKEEKAASEYTGPTAADLRKEAEAFRKGWEIEKQRLLDEAKAEADGIVKKAEGSAFEEMKRQTDQANIIKADAEKAAREIAAEAEAKAQKTIADAEADKRRIEHDAHTVGYDDGRADGFAAGKDEADRLIDRVHKMIEAVMLRREEILKNTESQIVELVVLMTRKIVKAITESQKTVIVNNVLAALKKVKGRGAVTVRVNMDDAAIATEHVGDFIKKVEGAGSITVVEDSTIEKGGCVVETDFGEIDARISSQLSELESKIMEISPIKSESASGEKS